MSLKTRVDGSGNRKEEETVIKNKKKEKKTVADRRKKKSEKANMHKNIKNQEPLTAFLQRLGI